MTSDFIIIGKVIKPQGNKGELKVSPLTDFPGRFKKLDSVEVITKGINTGTRRIEDVWYHKKHIVIKLKDCDTISQAEELRDSFIAITEDKLIKLPSDSYYWFKLLSLEVFTEKGDFLGIIEDIYQTPANDAFVVRNKGNEILIPALKQVVIDIDLERKKMVVRLPEGLL